MCSVLRESETLSRLTAGELGEAGGGPESLGGWLPAVCAAVPGGKGEPHVYRSLNVRELKGWRYTHGHMQRLLSHWYIFIIINVSLLY